MILAPLDPIFMGLNICAEVLKGLKIYLRGKDINLSP